MNSAHVFRNRFFCPKILEAQKDKFLLRPQVRIAVLLYKHLELEGMPTLFILFLFNQKLVYFFCLFVMIGFQVFTSIRYQKHILYIFIRGMLYIQINVPQRDKRTIRRGWVLPKHVAFLGHALVANVFEPFISFL